MSEAKDTDVENLTASDIQIEQEAMATSQRLTNREIASQSQHNWPLRMNKPNNRGSYRNLSRFVFSRKCEENYHPKMDNLMDKMDNVMDKVDNLMDKLEKGNLILKEKQATDQSLPFQSKLHFEKEIQKQSVQGKKGIIPTKIFPESDQRPTNREIANQLEHIWSLSMKKN